MSKHSIFSFVFFVSLLLVPFSLFAEEPKYPVRPEIDEVLKPFLESHDIAGYLVLVANKDGVVSFNQGGYADLESGKKMDENGFFWIASMTKGFTGVAVMMLVDEGKLSLDDPVTKFIPELGKWMVIVEKQDGIIVLEKPNRPVTIRDLMAHTSGTSFLSEIQMKAGLDAIPLELAALPSVTGPLQFQPGESYRYSNQGINIAGRVVEIVSGQSFEKFLQTRLFEPLGMNDTTFRPSDEQLSRLVTAYERKKNSEGMNKIETGFFKRPLSENDKRHAEPGGGLFSSIGDIYKFTRMLAHGGIWDGKRYLSENAVKELGKDQTGKLKLNYGLGWQSGGSNFSHGGAHGTIMVVSHDGSSAVFMIQGTGPAIGKTHEAFFKSAVTVLTNP